MFTLNCKGRLLVLEKPVVMGIINLTPDSFFPASRHQDTGEILRIAEKMMEDGATMIDIGGQSTRPGSQRISADEELQRVIDPLHKLSSKLPELVISIDTYYAAVASEAVAAGASIINDISAGQMDKSMIGTVAGLGVPYVLMHMKGTPETMQDSPTYENVTTEVLDFFIRRKSELLNAGIHQLIIDPGFGFGKTTRNNFELLKNLRVFGMLEKPLLLGLSRKSTIWRTLGITPEESLNGTTVVNTIGLMNGASILRVHDVKEAMEAIRLVAELA
jgi:dihydropteroate synthase